jgi:hypothetical protein
VLRRRRTFYQHHQPNMAPGLRHVRIVFQIATAQPPTTQPQRGRRPRYTPMEEGLKAPSLASPGGARCTNSIQLPASVEAVEPDGRPPLVPLQQIHTNRSASNKSSTRCGFCASLAGSAGMEVALGMNSRRRPHSGSLAFLIGLFQRVDRLSCLRLRR